ncbi:MAG: DUF402 domain-containing protein [Gemmatimonadales bacterium]
MFEQTLVHETGSVLVTYMAEAGVPRPVTVDDRVVLEARSPAVWFTFPAAHHDIGRFHTPAGELTGYYANILTPVAIRPGEGGPPDQWHTTDLFLDLFMTPAGRIHVLDRDELRDAVARGWVNDRTAAAAEREVNRLARLARQGAWPPAVVDEWPLERARSAARG